MKNYNNLTMQEKFNITGITFICLSPFFIALSGLMFWLRGQTEGQDHTAVTVAGVMMIVLAVLFNVLGNVFKKKSR